MRNIFDSHAHYNSRQFDSDREQLLGWTLQEKGVVGIVNMGSDLESCYATLELARRYDYIWGGVGIHPEDALDLPEDWLGQIQEMLKEPKIVAVGEIGLDYHWLDACPKDRQQEVFAIQLELARELALPVVVHDREAHADTLEFLKKYKPAGVVHCFSGSWETAREILDLGMYIGLGGVVTLKMPGTRWKWLETSPWSGLCWRPTPLTWRLSPIGASGTTPLSLPLWRKKLGSCGVWRPRRCWTSPRKTPGGCSTWGNGRGFSPERK